MSKVGKEARSFEVITIEDLHHLAEIARQDRDDFFDKYPEWRRLYADRFLCSALCQGAALHYFNGSVGIKDFDVYNFFRNNIEKRWYAKRLKNYDFGSPKFGQSIDRPNYSGRRVDVLGRGISCEADDDPIESLHQYLLDGKTETARLLAAKAVVMLEPINLIGKVIWPK